MKIFFVFILLFASILSAQTKIDSLFKPHDHFESLQHQSNPKMEQKSSEEKLSLQYLLLQSKINRLNEKFLLSNKLLHAEIQENYVFSDDELKSGLSNDDLIAYLKNKKETLGILAGTFSQHSYVLWDKIQYYLGLSKTAAAIILAMLNLIKYH